MTIHFITRRASHLRSVYPLLRKQHYEIPLGLRQGQRHDKAHLRLFTANATKKQEEDEGAQGSKSLGSRFMEVAPGVAAAAVVMQGGFMCADVLGKGLLVLQGIDASSVASPISGIPVSILLGLAIGNTFALPERLSPGIKFAQKTVLQAGVVCVGAKLSAVDLVTTGAIGLPAVCLSIAAGMTFVPWFGAKMGLPHKMSSLIAAGTSILWYGIG